MYAEKSRESYDRQACGYDSDSNMNGRIARQTYRQMIDRLAREQYTSLLDVGCGTGEMLSLLGDGPAKMAGIDISQQMLDIAGQKLGDRCDLRAGDATALPWESGTFDVVTCNYSFHHYEHPELVLAEMSRVLRKGGRIIVGDCWAEMPVRQIMNVLFRFGNDGDYHIYSKREICRLLANAGFTGVEWTRANQHAMLVTGIAGGIQPTG